jgi:flagellar protein FlgJ
MSINLPSVNSATEARRLIAGELKASDPKAGTTPADRKRHEVAKVAGQFEAIILRQMLAPAIEPLMKSGMGQGGSTSGGGGVYGFMLTDVLANSLSQGGGLGLSKMLQHQLTPRGASVEKAAAAYATGKMTSHE